MVPKIHAKGSSFKGAALYLLHDKDRASTDERVAWTEARNLAHDDPQTGWRIMVATAKDQERLKAEAGVKNTGRKSHKHVLHISLAWHPDQRPDREEMVRAADGALAAIGADDRQALIIAHNDEEHAHVHLLVNRVSPQDGRHLPSSNDRLKLSKWAEAYERKCGKILCEERVINNAMRAKGAYVKGAKDIARHIYEARPPANDNDRDKAVRAEQTAKDHALALRGRNIAALHAAAWQRLESAHQERKAALARRYERDAGKVRARVLEEFRPAWRDLNRQQASEKQTFEALEKSFFGRASNFVRTARLSAQDVAEGRGGAISRSFRILTNAGERRAQFDKAQERARAALEGDQAAKAKEALSGMQSERKAAQEATRAVYFREREDLAKSQEAERSRLQADWKSRTAEREAAFKELASKAQQREALKAEHNQAAKPKRDARDEILDRYARTIEFKKAARQRAQEQDNEQSRDDDHER